MQLRVVRRAAWAECTKSQPHAGTTNGSRESDSRLLARYPLVQTRGACHFTLMIGDPESGADPPENLRGSRIFLERSRYYLSTEYLTKLRLALAVVSPEAVWRRESESSNSIGNLLVHLAGNVREWIVEGIGGLAVDRDRALEFSRRDGPPPAQLLSDLESAVRDADGILAKLDPSALGRACAIQGRETTVMAALYHVVEHFAMHTGQVVLLAKMYAPGELRFYDDSGDLAIPLWGGSEGMKS